MTKQRLTELLCNAIEDIRDTWSGGIDDAISATGITEKELKELGFDTE